jgi:hypothetical protein
MLPAVPRLALLAAGALDRTLVLPKVAKSVGTSNAPAARKAGRGTRALAQRHCWLYKKRFFILLELRTNFCMCIQCPGRSK